MLVVSGEPLSLVQALAFLLAAWAVIGNDALQTLGPFLAANRGRTPRWLQLLFLCGVLCAVLLLGWMQRDGDASWGRLAGFPLPPQLGWRVLLAPLAVLLLTRWGAPVSTTFLVLTAFRPANLPALLRQSLLGYGLALVVGASAYGAAVLWPRQPGATQEPADPRQPDDTRQVGDTQQEASGSEGRADAPAPPSAGLTSEPPAPAFTVTFCSEAAPPALMAPAAGAPLQSSAVPAAAAGALALQWAATGWLWGQWLIQDLANLYVFLPRHLPPPLMALSLAVLCAAVALLLAENGGAIQEILRRKTALRDAGATTTLSLVYGLVLAGLAAISPQPLSTTWVFLGLLAGRELALQLGPRARPALVVARDLGRDLALAALGLAVSLAVALAVHPLQPGL